MDNSDTARESGTALDDRGGEIIKSGGNASTPPTGSVGDGEIGEHQYSTRSKAKKLDDDSGKSPQRKNKRVVVQPRLKPVPYDRHEIGTYVKQPTKTPSLQTYGRQFYQIDDYPCNKRGFKYKHCRPNLLFTSNLYSTSELSPYQVGPSYFDRSRGILFDDSLGAITTAQGWRSVRTNVGMREGTYYMEFNVINGNDNNSKGHVRLGIARREASLEAPVGFDGYGYGLRDVNGNKVHLSRPKEFFQEEGFGTGDVIGLLVQLPSLQKHKESVKSFLDSQLVETEPQVKDEFEHTRKKKKTKPQNTARKVDENVGFTQNGNISRDQVPIKYRNAIYYEQFEYTSTKKMDHLLNPVTVFGEKAILEQQSANNLDDLIPRIPDSKITVYKNGRKVGIAFEDLYSFLPTDVEAEELGLQFNTRQQQNANYRNTDDGSLAYYPMMSVFQGGIVEFNSGPEFKYPIEDAEYRPLSDRFEESVIEEWCWDIIDEVEADYLDSFEAQ